MRHVNQPLMCNHWGHDTNIYTNPTGVPKDPYTFPHKEMIAPQSIKQQINSDVYHQLLTIHESNTPVYLSSTHRLHFDQTMPVPDQSIFHLVLLCHLYLYLSTVSVSCICKVDLYLVMLLLLLLFLFRLARGAHSRSRRQGVSLYASLYS